METETRRTKNQSIQLLRFFAAFIVAYSHIAFSFAIHIADQRGLPFDPPSIALSRVALFFLISGAVMVIASSRYYGLERGWKTFLQRRMVRILPVYWAATFSFAAWKIVMGVDIDWSHVALSLALVPYWSVTPTGHPLPFLWPAWTLFYEAMFYIAFALALFLPRNRAVFLISGILLALVLIGTVVDRNDAFLFMATRPVLLLFVPGMALGLALAKGVTLRTLTRVLILFLAFASIPISQEFAKIEDLAPLGLRETIGIGFPAFLISLAVLAGPLPLAFPRVIERLGDMSYAIFLFHVPIVSFWIWFYQKAMPNPGPWGFLVSCLAVTLVASYLSYRFFELPLADWLNARLSKQTLSISDQQRINV